MNFAIRDLLRKLSRRFKIVSGSTAVHFDLAKAASYSRKIAYEEFPAYYM